MKGRDIDNINNASQRSFVCTSVFLVAGIKEIG